MAKKGKPVETAAWAGLPPDIFWITPDGSVKDVIGHLTAMQGDPEAFGLPASPRTTEEIDFAFKLLWAQGWVRGRFDIVEGVMSLQMERPRGLPMGNAYDMVSRHAPHISQVHVDFAEPAAWKMRKEFSAEDFLAQKFPSSWGLGSRRKR